MGVRFSATEMRTCKHTVSEKSHDDETFLEMERPKAVWRRIQMRLNDKNNKEQKKFVIFIIRKKHKVFITRYVSS